MNTTRWTIFALVVPALTAVGCAGNSGASLTDLTQETEGDASAELADEDSGARSRTRAVTSDAGPTDPPDEPSTETDTAEADTAETDGELDTDEELEADEHELDAAAEAPLDVVSDGEDADKPAEAELIAIPSGDTAGDAADTQAGSPALPRELIDQSVFRIEATGSFATPLSSENLSVAGGTGFVIDEQGHALTNAHVVSGATLLRVRFPGEDRDRNAQVVARAECSDLALMKIGGDAPFAHLDWSEQPAALGTSVVAIGYPLGDELTLTTGIVSKESTAAHTSWASVDDVLEHTALINPGSSGGPLLTTSYEVMGVNFAASEHNQYYAVGELETRALIDRLRAGEDVHSIGLTGTAVAATNLSGIWVYAVEAGSPADRAGIEPGDLITHFGNLPLVPDASGLMSMEDYCDILRSHAEDDAIDVRLLRWSTGETWEGQINGRELGRVETTSVAADTRDVAHTANSIFVEVPARWDEDASYLLERYDGVPGHALVASHDEAGFTSRYDVAGVSLAAFRDTSLSPDTLLDALSLHSVCTDASEREDTVAGEWSGSYEVFSGCPGDPAVTLLMVLATADHVLVVHYQAVTTDDLDALDPVLESIRVDPPALP